MSQTAASRSRVYAVAYGSDRRLAVVGRDRDDVGKMCDATDLQPPVSVTTPRTFVTLPPASKR